MNYTGRTHLIIFIFFPFSLISFKGFITYIEYKIALRVVCVKTNFIIADQIWNYVNVLECELREWFLFLFFASK